jgi:sulfate adenylyltransferase
VGGIAICAAIAPYAEAREENRQLISQDGGYIEIYLATSFDECAKRDTKGLYAKALKGELIGFTGYNDPYEAPINPEISIDTSILSVDASIKIIINYLKKEGYLKASKEITRKVEEVQI